MPIKAAYREGDEYGTFGVADPDKGAILRFFKATRYDVAAAGYLKDEKTGKETNTPELATMRDGYVWSNKDAYHFERYDLKLTEEFRAYALEHAPAA